MRAVRIRTGLPRAVFARAGHIVALAALTASHLAWPVAAQERYAGSAALDQAIESVVAGRAIPGAVLLVGQGDKILHRKAYGRRALIPRSEPMTVDTIFDIASLTKVVATTPAIMQLVEEGKVRLDDPVTVYLPKFQGKSITVRQLLTHYSGLRADLDLEPAWSGYETGIERAMSERPFSPPGESFTYSDINFILLNEIIRTVSGEPLDQYARKHIFEPLAMAETRYLPPESWKPRIAPTEVVAGAKLPLRGEVHDDTTRYMGGVSGHAGVFSTANDLARFARMMLNGGTLGTARIAKAQTVAQFTSPNSPPGKPDVRGLGWDIDSRYSSNRGDLFPIGSYGHTGFTGTSLWIDPSTKTYVILLANSVHPKRGFSLVPLRRKVATIVASNAGIKSKGTILTGFNERAATPAKSVHETLSGLETAAAANFEMLRGQRVALITNNTGIDRRGRRNVDLMLAAGVNVVALLSPEHGLSGQEDTENVVDARDELTNLPVWSLYRGNLRRPPGGVMANVDTLVFDIQDIGTRFYTYMCTMLYSMEEASKAGKAFVVLDRPNPIGGVRVEGPMLEPDLQSFTGCYPLPLRHGMTLGEIARMANEERGWKAKLTVVPLTGWKRDEWYDQTGLLWVNPSPNMRSLTAAVLYPGVAMLEYSKNYSVGRGTGTPFEMVGAEWINGVEFARYLNRRKLEGVRFVPVIFRPASDPLKGKKLQGAKIVVSDRARVDAGRLGVEIATALEKLYPKQMDWKINERLIGNREWIRQVAGGADPAQVQEALRQPLEAFLQARSRYLLY